MWGGRDRKRRLAISPRWVSLGVSSTRSRGQRDVFPLSVGLKGPISRRRLIPKDCLFSGNSKAWKGVESVVTPLTERLLSQTPLRGTERVIFCALQFTGVCFNSLECGRGLAACHRYGPIALLYAAAFSTGDIDS